MCNLAGYIGTERAAPILLKMIKEQEGFGGGYDTGIATIHEGKLHWRKVLGDTDELLKQTDAMELPGTTGIVHSRSKGYGDVEWGHPFINPDENMALILNGHMGAFYEDKENARKIVHELCDQGYKFKTYVHEFVPYMFQFENGDSIHMSEAMCLLTDSIHKNSVSKSWNEALTESASRYPAEIVSLMLCAETPGCIHSARFNQPLMVGRTSDATYLSSSALAFPVDMDSICQAPTRSAIKFTRDSFEVKRLKDQTGKVADIFPMAEGYARIEALLAQQKEGCTFPNFKDATKSLWPENMAPQKDMMVYEIMRLMYQQGKIRFEDSTVPGILEGSTAPVKLIFPT